MTRRRGSSEISFFNFSFLDILACTIGVLVFIISVVILHTLGMSAPYELRTELSELNKQVRELDESVDQHRSEAERLRRAQQALDQMKELEKELKRKSDALKELEAEIAELMSRLSTLESKDRELSENLPKLRALMPDDFDVQKRSIEIGTPFQKDSSKDAVYFECSNGRVNPFYGRYIRKYYIVRDVGESSVVIRRRPGESLEQTRPESSDWQVETKKIDRRKEYAAFIVRPTGFEIFLQLRDELSARGIEVGWEPLEAGSINLATQSEQFRRRFRTQ